MASKVYWADLRADFHENLQQKLTRLMKTAGMGEIDFDRKFVAIKMHFGEPGNLAFLRPNWAKTVADFVKERGGKPFLTDCNTLYVGGRKNGLDHLDTACLNGFNPMTTGCQVIIADGIKGAFSESDAEAKFNKWMEEKLGKIASKESKLATDAKAAEKARLAAEAKVKEERAKAIAEKKAAEAAAAAEAEGAAAEGEAAEAPAEGEAAAE